MRIEWLEADNVFNFVETFSVLYPEEREAFTLYELKDIVQEMEKMEAASERYANSNRPDAAE